MESLIVKIIREKGDTPANFGWHYYRHKYRHGGVEGHTGLPMLRKLVWDYRGFTLVCQVVDANGVHKMFNADVDVELVKPFIKAIPKTTWLAFSGGLIDTINVAIIPWRNGGR